jgi:hypothetical protein
MAKRKPLTTEEMAAELAKLDLLPDAEAQAEADAMLRGMLARPPDPFTPKRDKSTKPLK